MTKRKLAFKARQRKRPEETQKFHSADLALSGLVQSGPVSALHRQESQLSRDPEGPAGFERFKITQVLGFEPSLRSTETGTSWP